MKVRILKNRNLYYPQYKWFCFWIYFSKSDIFGYSETVFFLNSTEAIEFLKNKKPLEKKMIVWKGEI